jgi:DNA-binding MarR family transcriptional regulator
MTGPRVVAEAPVSAGSRARLRAWLQLLKLTRGVEAELRERLRREFGWTLSRFDVLAVLARAEAGMRMSDLAGALVVSNGNVTALVDALAVDGLVVRVRDDNDRRASIVRLTGTGRESFAAIAAVHAGWIDELLGGIDPAGAEALAATLQSARMARRPA